MDDNWIYYYNKITCSCHTPKLSSLHCFSMQWDFQTSPGIRLIYPLSKSLPEISAGDTESPNICDFLWLIITIIIVMISIHNNVITGFIKPLFWKTKYLKNKTLQLLVKELHKGYKQFFFRADLWKIGGVYTLTDIFCK